MKTVYVVSSVPIMDRAGEIIGWVRVDVFADGSSANDAVYLRGGTTCGQAEAIERVAKDPSLMYPTREAAVRDGIARLRAA